MSITKTDPAARIAWFDDEVTSLRVWGAAAPFTLTDKKFTGVVVGTDETCALGLPREGTAVSGEHCKLTIESEKWIVRDLGSKHGTFIDGSQRDVCVISPGTEIRIGNVMLIAESVRSAELHQFLRRLLGWRADRIDVADHALGAVRLAAMRRVALMICGDGDLVPVAADLHRRVAGPDKPFVSCDPKRKEGEATVRSVANYKQGMRALEAARGGVLCVRAKRYPRDFNEVVAAVRNPRTQVQLVFVADAPVDVRDVITAPIRLPSLRGRGPEIDKIIDEYGADALASLSLTGPFTETDRAWVRMHSAKSLADIDKGTRRLMALLHTDSIAAAAELLGMASASLQEWLGRRTLPRRKSHASSRFQSL